MTNFVHPLLSILIVCSVATSAFAAGSNAVTREGREAAERIERNGERDANRGNERGERDAERAAREARDAKTPAEVRQIERDYNKG
jgi:hypothetical protein